MQTSLQHHIPLKKYKNIERGPHEIFKQDIPLHIIIDKSHSMPKQSHVEMIAHSKLLIDYKELDKVKESNNETDEFELNKIFPLPRHCVGKPDLVKAFDDQMNNIFKTNLDLLNKTTQNIPTTFPSYTTWNSIEYYLPQTISRDKPLRTLKRKRLTP